MAMEMVTRNNRSYLQGSGFPGWRYCTTSFSLLTMISFLPVKAWWAFWTHDYIWSGAFDLSFSLLNAAMLMVFTAIICILITIYLAGLREWSTTYLLWADRTEIEVLYARGWGLLTTRSIFPIASVGEINARMLSAIGERMNLDVYIELQGKRKKVFRSGRSAEIELVVAYLTMACGRPVTVGTAERLETAWASAKARIAERD